MDWFFAALTTWSTPEWLYYLVLVGIVVVIVLESIYTVRRGFLEKDLAWFGAIMTIILTAIVFAINLMPVGLTIEARIVLMAACAFWPVILVGFAINDGLHSPKHT